MIRVTGNISIGVACITAVLVSTSGIVEAQQVGAGTTPRRAPNQAEQAANARAAVQRGATLAQRISQMLEEARRETDIIRVTCLNDKLTQANANLRTAQTRLLAFENATTPEQRNHEATVLNVLGQKFQVLDQEANRCVGQDLYDTGSTQVETDIDTALLPFEENPITGTTTAPSTIIVPDSPVLASGVM